MIQVSFNKELHAKGKSRAGRTGWKGIMNKILDEHLQKNEEIERAVAALQQEPTQEMLAHVLTVIRRRMNDGGQFVVAVDVPAGSPQMHVQVMKTEDGSIWWSAFTSFEEELRGSSKVMSTFLGNIKQLFEAALKTEGINGIIINPWNRTIMLDKELIRIILREN